MRTVLCALGAAVMTTLPATAQVPGTEQLPGTEQVPAFEQVATPNIARVTNQLNGVYASGPGDIWAVGNGYENGVSRTLIARSTGGGFALVPSGNVADRSNDLVDVHGTGPADIWAVGSTSRFGNGTKTLIQHWNGSAWSIVPSPNLGFGADHNVLGGVAAIAPDDAWAVGSYRVADSGVNSRPLILHWDGTAWRTVASECAPTLEAVSASGPDDIWAVGGGDACHFDGTSWTRVRAAQDPIASRHVSLLDVSVTPSELWAVGFVSIPCGENVCANAEIQRFDGARWTRAVPSSRFPNRWVVAVHALSATDVWAATTTGLLHYDGASWTEVAAPRIAHYDITAATSTSVWSVGSDARGAPSKTAAIRSVG